MKEKVCTNCGYLGKPKRITKGSFGMELLLWLVLLIPGLIYSLWRLASRYEGCPKCGAPHMLPVDSPRAVQILRGSGKT